MKNKYIKKTMMLSAVFIIFILPISTTWGYHDLNNKNPNIETDYKIQIISTDNDFSQKQYNLNEKEFDVLISVLDCINEKIKGKIDLNNLQNVFRRIRDENNHPIIDWIYSIISEKIGEKQQRLLVISYGWGTYFNPFKENQIKFYKPWIYWRYIHVNDFPKPKTYAISIVKDQTWYAENIHAGLLTDFRGIYIYIAKQDDKIANHGFTFFIGTGQNLHMNYYSLLNKLLSYKA